MYARAHAHTRAHTRARAHTHARTDASTRFQCNVHRQVPWRTSSCYSTMTLAHFYVKQCYTEREKKKTHTKQNVSNHLSILKTGASLSLSLSSLRLSLSLFLFLSHSLSLSLSLSLLSPPSLSLSFSLSLSLSRSLSLSLFLTPSLPPSLSLSLSCNIPICVAVTAVNCWTARQSDPSTAINTVPDALGSVPAGTPKMAVELHAALRFERLA